MKEKYILAAMLMDELALSKALSELTESHFTTYRHMFKDFKNIYNKEKCLDIGLIIEKGYSIEQITDISMSATTSVYIDKYIEKLKEQKYIRDCKEYANKILNARTIESLDEVVSNQPIITGSKEIITLEQACQNSLNNLTTRAKKPNSFKGVPTGYGFLDYITGGWKKGEIILIEGQTNAGKSILAQNIAINMARDNFIMYFGLEMPKQQLADRLVMMHFNILTTSDYNNPKTVELARKKSALAKYKDDGVLQNLVIVGMDEMKFKTLTEIKAITFNQTQNKRKKPKAIFIDYLRLIRGGNGTKSYERMQDNFNRIMDYASELMIPIVLIVSQNKQGDTAGSADMLYDAHQHYLLTRDGEAGLIEIKKNRDGGKGDIKLMWQQDYLKFEELRSEC